jgi:hypothetical protein
MTTKAQIERSLEEALALIDKQRDYDQLATAVKERVLRTPELTPKQEALMEEFGDEMPAWAQLSYVQSENERMREELHRALDRTATDAQ